MKQIIFLLGLFFVTTNLFSQKHTLTEIARDTIVDIKYGFSNRYYLDNKLMTIPVMMWFMQEYSQPNKNIKTSYIFSNVGGVYLGMGGGFIALGTVVRANDKALSNTFLTVGGIGVGLSALAFYIGNKYKKKAVKQYNAIISAQNRKKYGLHLDYKSNGLALKLAF